MKTFPRMVRIGADIFGPSAFICVIRGKDWRRFGGVSLSSIGWAKEDDPALHWTRLRNMIEEPAAFVSPPASGKLCWEP
jgi:hypothetical protein